MKVTQVEVSSILTRSSGYLSQVCSHSLQPYRGCSLGNSLCGQYCYVRHNPWVTEGRAWGSFLEVRTNASSAYLSQYQRERNWARRHRGAFEIFMASATEPFLPQETQFGITRSLLEAMTTAPPDLLILQTRSPQVVDHLSLLKKLPGLRVHLTIESDCLRLNDLPSPASQPATRFEAARKLRAAGIHVVITVSPLLPLRDPESFFAEVAASADAVVLDHFIGGDGSPRGSRTLRTPVPVAMAKVQPTSVLLSYRDEMVDVAQRHLPGRVGVHIDGFAGRYL
ncbi:unnamed protein product, partial [Phaeothamnion confervicola]